MKNTPPKLRSRMITFFLTTVLSGFAFADSPKLCDEAKEADNYDTDFLDNFITLQEGEEGWLFRDSDLKTEFGPGKKGYQRFHYLNKLLNQHGTQLMMVPIPTRGIIETKQLGDIAYDSEKGQQAYTDYLQSLRHVGIIIPKLETLFKAEHNKPLFFARDHHWTSYGAKQVAKLTARTIKQQDFYKEANKQEFETSKTGTLEMEGSHQKAAEQICETTYTNEFTDAYTTENISELDLFGDVAEPEVVLVGTSNSKAKLNFNFSGYLMQYSKLDILNLAKSGGGYDGAILDYLKSKDFKTNPAKLLIWEVPGYYSLNSKSFYKKIVRLLKPKKDKGKEYANAKSMDVVSR